MSVAMLPDVGDRDGFAALRGEWNALVDERDPQPFYRHEYVASFLDNFAAGAPFRIVLGRDRSGRLATALPLVAGRGSICGIPVRELRSPTNVHSLRFDLVARDAAAAAEELFEHLAADTSWDVLRLTDVP